MIYRKTHRVHMRGMIKMIKKISNFILALWMAVQAGTLWADAKISVADFESLKNDLGGDVGVYGSLEPDWNKTSQPYSCLYSTKIHDAGNYSKKNIHKGNASFRLVHGTGAKIYEDWGSFGINLGPIRDESQNPVLIEPLNVTPYRYFTFWIKGQKGEERFAVSFRDQFAKDYLPQYKSKRQKASKTWRKVSIKLSTISKNVALDKLVNVSVIFGKEQGSRTGDIIYIDDCAFSVAP